jgi:ZIP family zinc transporter
LREDIVLGALLMGAAAQTSLLLSGLAVYLVRVPSRAIGALAGFGAGALIAAVSFDLIPQSADLDEIELAAWLLIGALIFVVSDRVIESRFGGGEEGGGPLGIVVGSVVDGVPESLIFGIQLGVGDTLSAAFVAAVWVSNIPQALAPSAALAEGGWPPARLGGMWAVVVLVCAIVAGLGYAIANADPYLPAPGQRLSLPGDCLRCSPIR